MIRISVFSLTENEIPRKDQEVVADKETDGDTLVCYHCEYAARSKRHLIHHMKVHRNRKYIYSCCFCDFRTNSGILFTTHNKTHSLESKQFEALHVKEENMDDNFSQGNAMLIDSETSVVNKRSSRARESVSSKVHQCTKCNYKTTKTEYLKRHLVTHSDNRIISRCLYCNKPFTRKLTLDDHIVRSHPDFIASVSSKVYECTKCTYKTVISHDLKLHMVTHSHIADNNRIARRCIYCDKTFKSKQGLNYHIIKRHPDFIASVSRTVHECTKCTYKTVYTSDLKQHMVKHSDIADKNRIISRCLYCNKPFTRKLTLDDHIVRSHPDFIASVSGKVHECTKCTYKTVISHDLKLHMVTHSHIADNNRIARRCIYCDKTFTRKQGLDDHIIKMHPDFTASVSSKVHECTKCAYKTTGTKTELPRKDQEVVADKETDGDTFVCYHCEYAIRSKRHLIDHMKVHRNRKYIYSCCYCDFRTNLGRLFTTHNKTHSSESKQFEALHIEEENMDDNFNQGNAMLIDSETSVVNKRSSRARESVSSKVHQCTKCNYKTTKTEYLKRHLVTHSDNRIAIRCTYCTKTFKRKQGLDDHIIKTHPDFIASISSKIHQCTQCTYKTTISTHIRQHLITNHPEVAGNRILSRCIYCNKTFKGKVGLDDHIVKKHPDFIASVSSKIHECTQCTYKTTMSTLIRQHLITYHPEVAGNRILSRCIYCDKTFVHKQTLDDHIVRKHPDFIASVSRKIHQCTHCTYKTTISLYIRRHLITNHPEVAGNRILSRCIYCNKTFKGSRAAVRMILISFFSGTKNELSRKDQEVVADKETDGDTFVCYHCEYAVRSKRHLIDHMKVHRNRKYIYSCCYCDFRTNSGRLFTTHNQTHSSESKQFKALHLKEENMDDNFSQGNIMLIDSETSVVNKRSSRARKRQPHFRESVSSKVHQCTKCNYKTISTKRLKRHLVTHSDNRIARRCIYCTKTFKCKQELDDHIIKTHPDFIASISSKIHQCTQCTYKTTKSLYIRRHLITNHPEVAGNLLSRCIYCNKTFKFKITLDDHIIKTHPDFIASISSKIHQCTQCTYKTTRSLYIRRHLITNHPEVAGNLLSRCIYCNKTFKFKITLDDHIIKAHPDFIASISSKIHQCTQCTYKTTISLYIRQHLITNHPEIAGNCILRCIYCNCNKTFKRKQGLDDHIIKTHPDFIASVSSKIHECTQCTYKTTRSLYIRRHLITNHPEITGNRILSSCLHCNKAFKCKRGLDYHIIKRHPDFIASVSSKIHECTQCTYKTTDVKCLREHLMIKHHEIAGDRILSRCIYCDKTFKSKPGLNEHIIKIHPDFIASVSSKIHECTQCTYKTTSANFIKDHLRIKHHEIAGNRMFSCIYCDKIFTRKLALDDHIVKAHPDFIASVTRKIHECTQCTYKTTVSANFRQHLIAKHPDVAVVNVVRSCIHCNKPFIRKQGLDDHIIKTHPDFIASVSSTIHECTQCTYKTTIAKCLKNHLLIKHPEIAGDRIFSRCIYCNKTFKSKPTLDDHIINTHPDFIASISSKIHECTQCTYKTTMAKCLKNHLLIKHPEIAGDRILSRCIYCNKTFKCKTTLNEHIIKIHPDSIASVSSKIHECTQCTYKTTMAKCLKNHLLIKHPEIAGDRIFSRCIYCTKTFTRKITLDDHIIKTHPDFIASVSRKVHECTKCTYKTVFTTDLKRHMVTHSHIPDNNSIASDKTFAHKQSLDDHIVRRHTDDDHMLREHPNSIISGSKIREGTKCTDSSNNHMLKHSESVYDSYI
ncbi:unnamed protein product [Callosobruchus maculatus]|uniref:C2H2-type domain-containing protein n=1 Tax=Callosobruchus maculatus TaxID=64391 RepID=A0A653BJY3_CALMS|nr:unnamed protein product [Callosobruchus maculatus]